MNYNCINQDVGGCHGDIKFFIVERRGFIGNPKKLRGTCCEYHYEMVSGIIINISQEEYETLEILHG